MTSYDPELIRSKIMLNFIELVKDPVEYCEIFCSVAQVPDEPDYFTLLVIIKTKDRDGKCLDIADTNSRIRAVMSNFDKNLRIQVLLQYNGHSQGTYFDNHLAWWMEKK